MARVYDLQPGDLVTVPGSDLSGTFIAQTPHPSYPGGLSLVIWKMSDGTFSFDALLPNQEIGEIKPATGQERGMRLMMALKNKNIGVINE